MRKLSCFFWCAVLLISFGCQQGEIVSVPDNTAPPYDGVSTIRLENYINRLFIDLIGREPVDIEMSDIVDELREGDLDKNARKDLVTRLQSGTDFVEGDSSYKYAYYQRFYDQAKVRMIEGSSDELLEQRMSIYRNAAYRDSLSGDLLGYQYNMFERNKLNQVIAARIDYREGRIPVNEVFGRMLYNWAYDQINMNSINFIRACFNDLFFRYHTQDEFDRSFQIIEFGQAEVIFGKSASNKLEYIDILINSREFYEGMIRSAYRSLLARDPNAAETEAAMQDFFSSGDLQKVQRDILISEEYAGF